MAGEAAAGGTQAEPAAAPQAGTPPPTQTATASSAADGQEQPQAGAPESLSLEEAKKLRSEAQSLRRRLKDFEDAQRAADEASLSEAERIKRDKERIEGELQSAQVALRELRLRTAIEREAAKRGFNDPADAYRLLDLAALELDEDGQPRHAESLLNALAKAKPYLVRTEPQPQQNGALAAPPLPVGATPRPANGAVLSDAARQAEAQAALYAARRGLGL